jgi:DNA-binding response OmpR family regulator
VTKLFSQFHHALTVLKLAVNFTKYAWRLDLAQLLVLSAQTDTEVLPALALLPHKVRLIPAEPASLVNAPAADLIFLDARRDLTGSKSLATLLLTTGLSAPLIVVVTEGGMAAISHEWGATDIILDSAGPAEIDARIRLSIERNSTGSDSSELISASGVVIDDATYSAKVHGKPMDLTFKEFELLRFLAQHPGRVFSREQLLSEVWGYDYFGGTRTVDVHIRRLRAKLGDLEALIGTVRNRGYCFNLSKDDQAINA